MELDQVSDIILKHSLKLGADDVVTLTHTSNSRQVKFVNNQIDINKAWTHTSADVIIIKDKKVAVTSIKEFTKEVIQTTLKKLINFTKVLKPSKEYMGIANGPFKYSEIENIFDKRIGIIGDDSIDVVESAINSALEAGAKRTSGVLDYGVSESVLMTSNNVEVKEKDTAISLSIRALLNRNASGHKISCSRVMKYFDPVKAGEEAGRIAKMAKNPKSIKPGKYTVLFDPLPFANLVEHIASATSITSVETGLSFFMNKLNQEVASPILTLWDDGRIPAGLGSSKSDEEGVPTQRTSLINDGVLKNYLHNTSTAKKYNTKTTANAGIISPHPTNAVVKEGDKSIDEMISEIKKGLYITNTWYTRFQNYMTGDFSSIPRDGIFYIVDGEIKHPTREIRISDNFINLMMNISSVGKEISQIHGWGIDLPTFTPAVLVDNLNITKSTFKKSAQS
jgi:PmbA protein